MPFRPDIANQPAAPARGSGLDKTLDLRAIAMVGRAERVEIQRVADRTLDAFDQTLRIISNEGGGENGLSFSQTVIEKIKAAPRNSELKKVFVFAEILGGYDAFNDLTRKDSPGQQLYSSFRDIVGERKLTPRELEGLEEYHAALKQAIENAKTYYRDTRLRGLSLDEMNELYAIVLRAREKAKEITEIIGKHLILCMEEAIARLNEIRLKALGVERSVNGIFLVDDEVMFIPVSELQDAINIIFKGVGNPYLADHVDGVMLLAARNLLIEVVSFFAYYGKHQIYQLFKHGQTVDRRRMTLRIRNEIRTILNACKENNKLVLTRIMAKEEEQLDLSIEAIRAEAEKQAVREVIRIVPEELPAPPAPKKEGWLRRISDWFTG